MGHSDEQHNLIADGATSTVATSDSSAVAGTVATSVARAVANSVAISAELLRW